jgi:hypothetical protein
VGARGKQPGGQPSPQPRLARLFYSTIPQVHHLGNLAPVPHRVQLPDPHQSDKLDPDPHQFADDKPKYEPILALFQGFELLFGS